MCNRPFTRRRTYPSPVIPTILHIRLLASLDPIDPPHSGILVSRRLTRPPGVEAKCDGELVGQDV